MKATAINRAVTMSKGFRDWDVEQVWLLPPSVQELVPEGHRAHLVRELVRESLDLTAIFNAYKQYDADFANPLSTLAFRRKSALQ